MKVMMKFIASLAIVATLVLAANQNIFAQARPSSATQDIAGSPVGLLVKGPFTIQYEWKAANLQSWAVRLHLYEAPAETYRVGFGIGGAYRFFIADSRALTGLSVAPAADIIFYGSSQLLKSPVSFQIGGDIAYKWIFDQISLEPMFGLRIGFGGAEGITSRTGLQPVLQVFVGYAWK